MRKMKFSYLHRLRKHQRKKCNTKDPVLFDKYARYYWRYHFKIWGKHQSIYP